MLLGRERDIQVVDLLARRDLCRLFKRAEHRQTAVAEVIARAIVDEADDLIAKLAVFDDLVGDDAAKLARAGDENAPQPEPRLPATLEHFAHDLPQRERQPDVEDDEQRPDRVRDLVGAAIVRRDVRLDVQRDENAEDNRDDRADEDGEEVVDPRPAAAQPVEILQVEPDRHEHRDERQQVQVLPQRRNAFGDGNQSRVKAERVGDDECGQSEQRIRRDVEGDEQPVETSEHQRGPSASAAIAPLISSTKRSRLKRSALRRMRARSNDADSAREMPSANAGAERSSTRMPVLPSTTVSVAPPRASATTGVPHACASTGTMPKSSSPGRTVTAAPR